MVYVVYYSVVKIMVSFYLSLFYLRNLFSKLNIS